MELLALITDNLVADAAKNAQSGDLTMETGLKSERISRLEKERDRGVLFAERQFCGTRRRPSQLLFHAASTGKIGNDFENEHRVSGKTIESFFLPSPFRLRAFSPRNVKRNDRRGHRITTETALRRRRHQPSISKEFYFLLKFKTILKDLLSILTAMKNYEL